MQQIVFNGHYLMYFDTAVAGYWRALALPYHETMAALGGRPLRAQGDARIRGLGALRRAARRRHPLRAHRQHRRCCCRPRCSAASSGWCTAIWSTSSPTRRAQTAKPVPPALRDVLHGASRPVKPMIDVRIGDWATLGSEARRDPRRGVHPGAGHSRRRWSMTRRMARRCTPSPSTASAWRWAPGDCSPRGAGVAKIGRMAVLASVRGAGIGRPLLDALVDAARARGDRRSDAARAGQRGRLLSARRFRVARAGVRRGRHRAPGDGAQAALTAPAATRGSSLGDSGQRSSRTPLLREQRGLRHRTDARRRAR